MNKYTILIALAIAFVACDTSEDYFKDSNLSPEILVKGQLQKTFSKELQDSVKLENTFYTLHYQLKDEEAIQVAVQVDSIFRYEINDETIIFGAEKAGTSNIYISAIDSWDRKAEVTIKLTCFKNLPPVSSLEVVALANEREYKLDAAKSLDQDAKYGGKITLYRFYINGKEIDKTYHSELNYTFPKTGEYKVGVQVQDNNGDWSKIAIRTINI